MSIVIENVGEDTYILMARGHHQPSAFMASAREDGYEWPLGMPKHVWVRKVPTRNNGYRCIYALADKPGRGAFPATYSWEAYGDDRYEDIVAKAAASIKAAP